MSNTIKRVLDSKYFYCLRVFANKVSFAIFKIFPVNENKIVFLNFHSDNFTGNNRAIYEELIRRKFKLKYIMISNSDIRREYRFSLKKFIKTIIKNYNLCTARYIIVNDNYSLFSMITLRKETDLIQVWHGGGAFKKFGRHSIQNINNPEKLKRYLKGSSQYTKVIVSSSEVSDIYADAFGIDKSKIYPIGLPRTDIFFDKDKIDNIKRKLLSKYEQLLNKRIIVYAPTFRDNDRNMYLFPLDLNYLFNTLDSDYVLVYKLHPRTRNFIEYESIYKSRVFDLSHEDINDLLILADILITDYSSLIFEYAILQKPVIFFAYDLEQYENLVRGFYYPYKKFVPGPIAYTTEEIVEYIKKNNWDLDKLKKFAMQFNEYFDGNATERFINNVLFEGQDISKVGEDR